jgi:hypothetical protein
MPSPNICIGAIIYLAFSYFKYSAQQETEIIAGGNGQLLLDTG